MDNAIGKNAFDKIKKTRDMLEAERARKRNSFVDKKVQAQAQN